MFKTRKLYDELLKHLTYKEFTIVTGARQVGKTTLLKQIFSILKGKKEKVWFLSFEVRDILIQIDKDPENLFRYTARPENPLLSGKQEKIYILIDEIQYAKDPTNFLKYLYDTYAPNLKVIATGSSAFYMDKKFKDSLSGRKKIFQLSTLNLEEFIIFRGKEELLEELRCLRLRAEYISLRRNELMELFNEYITFGGYPSVVLFNEKEDKIEMLREIQNSYLKKDIDDSKVENEDVFNRLFITLASQTGGLLNTNDLSNLLRIHYNTVEKYLYVLQKSFHIDILKPFFKNYKKEIVKMPKVYFNDLGLRNLLINNFSAIDIRPDKGELLENYVYLRLKEIYNRENIRFWRTTEQNELDFIIRKYDGSMNAYEVKFSPTSIKLSKYTKFSSTYPDVTVQFICYLSSDEFINKQVLSL